jgi:hypothetical protein
MNRYVPHVYVLPEDDCDRQLANGFVGHDQVKTPRIQVMPPVGGWREVLKEFQTEYVRRLREDPQGHVVLLVDFDGDYQNRRATFAAAIPPDVTDRVFVVGASQTPEDLKTALNRSFEQIGRDLAQDCFASTQKVWGHAHLQHNFSTMRRIASA